MSWFGDLFGGGKDPSQAAMPYLDKAGGLYGLGQDPAAFLDQLIGKYQPSQGFKMKEEDALRAAGNSAAAGGVRGTENDLKQSARISDMLMGEDMQQWLNNVMGITGNQANILNSQGGLAYQGQANKNKGNSDMLAGIMKALGTAGGAAFGGPAGAAVGGSLGDMLSKMFSGGGGQSTADFGRSGLNLGGSYGGNQGQQFNQWM